MEGLVFGTLAAEAMISDSTHIPSLRQVQPPTPAIPEGTTPDTDIERWIEDLRNNMWRYAGLLRDANGLEAMQRVLDALAATMPRGVTRRAIEARNLHAIAVMITASAQARRESRGAHSRNDFPLHEEVARHSVMHAGTLTFSENE